LEHTEGLGDLDGIEAEERALFTHLAAGAKVIGLADDPRVLRLVTEADVERRLTYGVTECASHRIVNRRSLGRERSELSVHRHIDSHSEVIRLVTRLCGLPGALASAAAVCVSDALNVPLDPDVALTALDQKVGEQGRLRVVERSDRALIIDDCYNANPISMRSSFQVAYELAQTEGRRLFFVLGDMRELGAHSQREHVALAEAITGVAAVVAVGTEMSAFVARAKALGQNVSHFDDADAAKGHVCAQIGPGDVVLVKGSRGVQLERVVAALTGGEGHAS
jgi:UDP-N-acetylmuramoyl-tripeptide--D-alanyl-D-alanine ligase